MSRILSLLGLAALSACAGDAAPPATGQGTVEVHEADIGPPVPATVLRILVDEGDRVATGDTLVILLQRDLDATIALRAAELQNARAVLRDLEAGAREPELKRAEAELAATEAEVARAATERERVAALTAGGHAAPQALDNAVAADQAAVARRDAARETVALLQAGTRPDRIAAARAAVATARAALRTAESRQGDLVLLAPLDGQVLNRYAEPGEVLSAGMPALTVGAVDRPWVKVYFPARVIWQLALGDSALIEIGDRVRPGQVTAIVPRAEFTPRVALTEEERSDLLFGVRVEPVGGDSAMHPGLWATIRLPGVPKQ